MPNLKSVKPNKDGTKTITLTVSADEALLVVRDNAYYRLGEDHGDIVRGSDMLESIEVAWCVARQDWDEIDEPRLPT